MKKIILLILISLNLSACETLKEKQETIINDKIGIVYIKPELFMQECEKLLKLENGSQKEIIYFSLDTVKKYKECSNKQKELSNWIERNIK